MRGQTEDNILYSHEMDYGHFLTILGDRSIVCVGIGRLFESHKKFFQEKGLGDRLLALADNDANKQGTVVNAAGKDFYIHNFDELIRLRRDHDFLILITSVWFEEIYGQIVSCPELKETEIIDGIYLMMHRNRFIAAYSNLFSDMRVGVGINGENMSISVLAHNRVELTVKLLRSIQEFMPEFRGEVLVGDNGSDEKEYAVLERELKNMDFDHRLLKFDRHYPITAGKNKLHRECRKKWILQLDNDVYFTDSPIHKINADIDKLGCRVWGLPYYDMRSGRVANYGSNLEFRLDETGERFLVCRVDVRFCERNKQWEPMLCTYSSGAATLMEKEFFMEMGMYDEHLYVHQDVEFMYRANLRGYKIGNIGMNCLVHDHKQIDSESGRKYEAIRYDEERIKKSRQYIRDKYGFKCIL